MVTSSLAFARSPTSGPVGTAVQVSGTGFKHKATVDIYFDSTLVTTAVRGDHLVTAHDTSDPARTATFAVIAIN